MSRLKEYIYDKENGMEEESVTEPVAREYPVKQRIDGYPVTHYYDGENPVWEIYDEDGNLVCIAHSHEELHSITGKEEN